MSSLSSFQSGSYAWFLQRVTAVVLVGALAFHLIFLHVVNHAPEITLLGSGLRMDGLVYLLFTLIFLIAAAYHGINGVYNALLNHGMSDRYRQILGGLLTIAGIVLVWQGVRVVLALLEVSA